eukprot:jgi/Psemu1/285515/fgenesh1_pg.91_\
MTIATVRTHLFQLGWVPKTAPNAVLALSLSPVGSREAFLSRIQTAQCGLQVSVGRIPGTAMPPEWAASGAKLGFPLEVEFCNESCADYDMTKERLLRGSSSNSASIKAVEPLNDPTFVSSEGLQTIKVTEGAYGCEVQNFQAQQYGLRFFLDFPEGAKRNDVELPAERIYFITSCWIQDEVTFERARSRHQQLTERWNELGDELATLSSESKGLLGRVASLRKMTTCVEQKKVVEGQLAELEQAYPLDESELVVTKTRRCREFVEGPKGLLFAKDGVIAVKRYRGAMETREQYHWVGTFSVVEFFEDLDEE